MSTSRSTSNCRSSSISQSTSRRFAVWISGSLPMMTLTAGCRSKHRTIRRCRWTLTRSTNRHIHLSCSGPRHTSIISLSNKFFSSITCNSSDFRTETSRTETESRWKKLRSRKKPGSALRTWTQRTRRRTCSLQCLSTRSTRNTPLS